MPLLTIRGPQQETFSVRLEAESISLGRAPGNDVMLDDPALSRTHATVRHCDGAWVIEDAGSRNGTRLNGRILEGPVVLRPGDEIGLGASRVLFEGSPQPTSGSIPVPTRPAGGAGGAVAAVALVGRSAAMTDVLDLLVRVAPSDATVLLTGESGTGKELAARFVHQRSLRADGPFVAVSCPALPSTLLEAELFGVERGTATGVDARAGRFELAAGGSIFLDEVADLDLPSQSKLLRVLQERVMERVGGRRPIPLDARIIAATNRDLRAAIDDGAFRLDLYHRLNVIEAVLPPLRSRREDIPILVEHFLASWRRRFAVSDEVLEILHRHDFPGNVRELEHLIERACLVCRGGTLEVSDLPEALREAAAPRGAAPPSVPSPADGGNDLYDRVVRQGQPFWDVAAAPFLRREIPRAAMRGLVERCWQENGRSYRRMAERLGIAADYKRLLNFLNHHGLGVDRARGRGR